VRGIRHPLSQAVYDVEEDGTVTVTAKDGRSGRFTADGHWIGGDLKVADAHLCGWVVGTPMFNRVRTEEG
jgi:hypothetical protein